MKYLLPALLLVISLKAGAQAPALTVADSLYAVGNYSAAIAAYNTINQQKAGVNLQLARSYKGLGIRTKALDYYQKSLTLQTKQPIAAAEYGQLLIVSSKFQKADSLFSILTKNYPDNAGYYYQWGRALKGLSKKQDTLSMKKIAKRQEELGGAKGAFAKAVQTDSTHQKALYELALFYLKEKEYLEVVQLTRRGLKNDSLDVEIINLSAQNEFNRRNYSTAIDGFTRLIALGVENEFIHRKLGNSYYAERYYALALEQYEKVVTYNEQDAGVHLILARLNNYLNNFEKAMSHAKAALFLQDQPLDEIYFTMGRAYELDKKYPQAIEALQKAVKENPDNLKAYHAIAICADNYYENRDEVLKLYEQALDISEKQAGTTYVKQLIKERIKILKQEIFIEGTTKK